MNQNNPFSSQAASQLRSLPTKRTKISSLHVSSNSRASNLTNTHQISTSVNPFDDSRDSDSDTQHPISNSALPELDNLYSDTSTVKNEDRGVNISAILPDSSQMTSDERTQVNALLRSRFIARFIDLHDRVEDLFRCGAEQNEDKFVHFTII